MRTQLRHSTFTIGQNATGRNIGETARIVQYDGAYGEGRRENAIHRRRVPGMRENEYPHNGD